MGAQTATPVLMQNRIVALCATVDLTDAGLGTPTTSTELGDCVIASTDLPLYEVKRGRLLGTAWESAIDFRMEWDFYIHLYVAELCENASTNEANRIIASNCILPTVDLFGERRFLDLPGTDNGGLVHDSRISAPTGDVRMGQSRKTYAGVTFRMFCITRRKV